ncbi:MAG: hypothetical protein M1395_04655 [Bacteroidetes bacterium]|nr:hypothetical protein [Bacteroidota bacterium]
MSAFNNASLPSMPLASISSSGKTASSSSSLNLFYVQQTVSGSGFSGNDGNLTLFGNVGNNILDSFRGRNAYYHLAGIAATALIVETGTDFTVEHYFNIHPDYGRWAHPVVFTGQFLPFVAGGSLLAYGIIGRDRQTLGASFAVIQTSLIEPTYNSAIKAITGRPHPDSFSRSGK